MSTQTKHTPGPWQANKWAPGFEVCAPGSHYTICSLAGYNNEEANAQLIAAAPDLLEACKMALATIERLTVRHGPFSSTDGTHSVLNEAIAKAEATANPNASVKQAYPKGRW